MNLGTRDAGCRRVEAGEGACAGLTEVEAEARSIVGAGSWAKVVGGVKKEERGSRRLRGFSKQAQCAKLEGRRE